MDETRFLERLRASGRADETLAVLDKLGFSRDFILNQVLGSSAPIEVARLAMLWQGMPNKHDRKRVRQMLDALTEAGLLSFDAARESWTVK